MPSRSGASPQALGGLNVVRPLVGPVRRRAVGRGPVPDDDGAGLEKREADHQMPRMLHLADARLGARHLDLGDAASAHRERQFAALAAAVDIAIAEKVELVLVAGDLFATGVASRRTVERAAAEIGRLVAQGIRTVILPGRNDPYDRASLYRAHDLAALAGVRDGDDLVTVLTTSGPVVHVAALDLVVGGLVAAGAEEAADLGTITSNLAAAPSATWRIGMVHAAPEAAGGRLAPAVIAATGLDYLALGGATSQATGHEGDVAWGVPGPPEQVLVDLPEPGGVLLVSFALDGGTKAVSVERRTTGRATHRAETVDVATLESQQALVDWLRGSADPDQLLDVHLTGSIPDSLPLEPADVEDQLRGDYLKVRVHDSSQPALTTGELPPGDTVAGAFIRSVEGRIADLEATAGSVAGEEAGALREVLRLGRRVLAGEEVRA
jgi:DNA repair exonuclease SbcCD nuclease subunit